MNIIAQLNIVYADVNGNIGWMGRRLSRSAPTGMACCQLGAMTNMNGAGDWGARELPKVSNAQEGFFASANWYNVPDVYPHIEVSPHEWILIYRYDRVMEVLGSGRKIMLGDSIWMM